MIVMRTQELEIRGSDVSDDLQLLRTHPCMQKIKYHYEVNKQASCLLQGTPTIYIFTMLIPPQSEYFSENGGIHSNEGSMHYFC